MCLFPEQSNLFYYQLFYKQKSNDIYTESQNRVNVNVTREKKTHTKYIGFDYF